MPIYENFCSLIYMFKICHYQKSTIRFEKLLRNSGCNSDFEICLNWIILQYSNYVAYMQPLISLCCISRGCKTYKNKRKMQLLWKKKPAPHDLIPFVSVSLLWQDFCATCCTSYFERVIVLLFMLCNFFHYGN